MLCCKYDWSKSEKWYDHQQDGVVENGRCKILCGMTIPCDHVIKARRPEIAIVGNLWHPFAHYIILSSQIADKP